MKGSCLCGAVRYQVDRLDLPIMHCHCQTCQKTHAATEVPTAGVLREAFRWLQGEASVTSVVSSPGKQRHFCQHCGTHLVAEREGKPHLILRVATLDETPDSQVQGHIWTAHDRTWLTTAAPRHRAWPQAPEQGETVALTIRRAGPDELPQALLLLADPDWDTIAGYLPTAICYVAEAGDEIVAVCVVAKLAGAEAFEIMNLAVAEARQQAGIGARLLQQVIDDVRARGARRLELGTGSFGHQLGFYQRHGFRVVAVEPDYFLNHYPEPIHENGLQHRDRLRLAVTF
ncbi:GNAT family N-acetyltransferase [Marinobacter xestospongiae]|uniref:GNAT family N-acetyltransferase n=1 Tax=Marinobacter xestospongiae TaxID=994319 RepID=UPI0031DD720D